MSLTLTVTLAVKRKATHWLRQSVDSVMRSVTSMSLSVSVPLTKTEAD